MTEKKTPFTPEEIQKIKDFFKMHEVKEFVDDFDKFIENLTNPNDVYVCGINELVSLSENFLLLSIFLCKTITSKEALIKFIDIMWDNTPGIQSKEIMPQSDDKLLH